MYNNILPVNSHIVEYVKAGNIRMDIANRPHCFSMKTMNDMNSNSLHENNCLTIVDGMSMKARSILDNDVISWCTKFNVKNFREYDLMLLRMPNDAEKNSGKLKIRLFKEEMDNKVYTYKFDDDSNLIESSSYHGIDSIVGKEEEIYQGNEALSLINEYTTNINFIEFVPDGDTHQAKLKKIDIILSLISQITKNDDNKEEIMSYIFNIFVGYGDSENEAMSNLKNHLNSGLNVFHYLQKNTKDIDFLSKKYFEFLTYINGYGCIKENV